MVEDLRLISQSDPDYPPILFVFQGSAAQGEPFFDGLWPEARAVSDTPKLFYNALGIERGGLKEMFGPQVFACGVRAARKGHAIGMPVGDPWEMPGMFLVEQDGSIRWQHDFSHAGDHPNFKEIPHILAAQQAQSAAQQVSR
ncbi:MAG: peroxiredoxin-like family protein [Chloroflexota bacterium]